MKQKGEPMTRPDAARPPGQPWRRRVRRLTAGVLGAAVLATGGITALLATGPDTAASTPTSASTGDDAATPPTGSASGSLTGPTQAPRSGTGRHHATTGGS